MAYQPKCRPTPVDEKRRQLIVSISSIGFCLPITAMGNIVNQVAFDNQARDIVTSLPAIENTNAISTNTIKNQPVLVTFFASWCPPCLAEFEHLNKLHQNFSNTGLQIIAINVHEQWDDNDQQRLSRFIATTRPVFPVVKGSEEIRNLFGGINRIPTVYGFDEHGTLRFDFIHARGAVKTNTTYEELKSAAQLLLR